MDYNEFLVELVQVARCHGKYEQVLLNENGLDLAVLWD